MLQMSHSTVARSALSRAPMLDEPGGAMLEVASMARYLREAFPASAHCFALQMQERVGWANASWGAYWAEIAELV